MFEFVKKQLNTMLLPEAFAILNNVYGNIKTDIVINNIDPNSVFWHRGYDGAFNNLVTRETEPKVFLKETIPLLRKTILIQPMLMNSTIGLKSKTKKEYIFVKRKEGKKRKTVSKR
tara:strand:- start:639 stop:986 length:348 start_codon:yes stop_codon:yes gene_type:complete